MDAEVAELIVLADAVGGLMHELNNCLNRVALQASVVQMQVDSSLRDEVAKVRHETAQAAALLRPFTLVRQRHRQARTAVNLNRAVEDVLAELPELSERVTFEPATRLPLLTANPAVLGRLVTCFLRLALAKDDPAQAARLWTERAEGRTRLVLAPTSASRFDPEADLDSPESLLLRLAMQSLLRLVEATLDVDDSAADEVALAWGP